MKQAKDPRIIAAGGAAAIAAAVTPPEESPIKNAVVASLIAVGITALLS